MKAKKLMALVLAGVMTAVLVTGCGDSKNTTKDGNEQIELDFFQMKNEAKDVYDKLIAQFEEENPGITINQISPADSEAVFLTNISTGDIPDIMSVYPAEAAYQNIMEEGIMADMTGEEVLKNAEESAVELSKYKGKSYVMPFALSSYGFFCNKAMFEEHNLELPTTYDELLSVAETFKAAGIDAIACNDKDTVALGQEAERIIGIIKNDVYKDFEEVGKGNVSFKDLDYVRTMAETMLTIREYGSKDSLAVGREQATSDFINGKYPMFTSGTWGLSAIMKAAPDMDVEMIPIPNPYKNGETTIPINVDIAIGYWSETKHPEEALKFIEFLARPEVNQILADEEGTPTVIKGVNYNIEPLKFMKDKMDNGNKFLTLVNYWPAGMRNEWAIPMQQLLTDKDVDKFLEATDKITVQYYNQN